MKLLPLILAILLAACSDSRGGEPETLFGELEPLARQGNPEAQYYVGMLYNNGIGGVRRDPIQAFEWFSKATTGGDPLGAYKVGCYFAGQFAGVVAVDSKKALYYKLIAAKAGYALAQADVGNAYYKQGKFDEALIWWRKAADQGFYGALYILSAAYREGRVVPKNHVLAYSYWMLALAQPVPREIVRPDVHEVMNEVTRTLSAKELAEADAIISSWKSQPTPLTQRVYAGLDRAQSLAKAARH